MAGRCRGASVGSGWPRPGPGSAGSRRSARVIGRLVVGPAPRAPVVAAGLVLAGHGVDSARSPRRPTTTVRVNRTWVIDTGAAAARVGAAAGETTGVVGGGQPGAHPARAPGRRSGSTRRRPTARPRPRRPRWRAARCGGTAGAEGCSSASWVVAGGHRARAEVGRERGAEREQRRPQVTRHRRRTREGTAQPALLGDLVGADLAGDQVAVPRPLAVHAASRPAAYSVSSSPWHCTRIASVIRFLRRGGG